MLTADDLCSEHESRIKILLTEDAELLDDVTNQAFDVSHGWFYKFIIQFLTNLEMDEEEAKLHYYRILEHRFSLSQKMHRDVGVRVATLDYFMHVSPRIKNPRFVEISIFEELLKMSKEDQKTGCYNAKFLHEFTLRELQRAARTHSNVSLLLMDIDNFKFINDRFGHLMGDKVIKRFAECLTRCARTEDVTARFGGDEFALLMPQTGRIGARSLAERFRLRLQEELAGLQVDGTPVPVTFSGGIATYPFDAQDYESLIQEADSALYHAKRSGRNHIFDKLEQAYEANWETASERRGAKRYTVRQLVSVGLNGFFGHEHLVDTKARIINISRGGLLLECNAKLAAGISDLPVNLELDGPLPGIIGRQVEGHVVRNLTEMNFLKFYLGVKLTKPMGHQTLLSLEQAGIIGHDHSPAPHPLTEANITPSLL